MRISQKSRENTANTHSIADKLPLFSNGVHLTDKELLACQTLAQALPEKTGSC